MKLDLFAAVALCGLSLTLVSADDPPKKPDTPVVVSATRVETYQYWEIYVGGAKKSEMYSADNATAMKAHYEKFYRNVKDKPKVEIKGPFTRTGDPFDVEVGQGLFDSEGKELSVKTSRRPHTPFNHKDCAKAKSGVTIGRGYDLGQQAKPGDYDIWKKRDELPKKTQAQRDAIRRVQAVSDLLTGLGLTQAQADVYLGALGKKGCDAETYLNAHREEFAELTAEQQKQLFETVYDKYVTGAKKVLKDRYGLTDAQIAALDVAVFEVLVDMQYQGCLNNAAVAGQIGAAVTANDGQALAAALGDYGFWFGTKPVLDKMGKPVLDKNGKPVTEPDFSKKTVGGVNKNRVDERVKMLLANL